GTRSRAGPGARFRRPFHGATRGRRLVRRCLRRRGDPARTPRPPEGVVDVLDLAGGIAKIKRGDVPKKSHAHQPTQTYRVPVRVLPPCATTTLMRSLPIPIRSLTAVPAAA